MDLTIQELKDVPVTGLVRVLTCADQVGLYMDNLVESDPEKEPFTPFSFSLTALPFGDDKAVSPGTLSLPLNLPVSPTWDIALSKSDEGELIYTPYDGGWFALNVDSISADGVETAWEYAVEDTTDPHFVLQSRDAAVKQPYISAILSGYQFGIIGLQEQDGQQVPHVSGIVGTSTDQVSVGRAFGDLSNGLPKDLTVVYLQHKNVGPLAPSGAFCGPVTLAAYDVNANKLSNQVDLVESVELSDFDIAVADQYMCMLGVTGDGAPLIGLYDQTGKALGTPNLPAGSWSNAGRWVTSPTIVATPQKSGSSGLGFSFAFIEMENDQPVAVHTGTLAPPPTP